MFTDQNEEKITSWERDLEIKIEIILETEKNIGNNENFNKEMLSCRERKKVVDLINKLEREGIASFTEIFTAFASFESKLKEYERNSKNNLKEEIELLMGRWD